MLFYPNVDKHNDTIIINNNKDKRSLTDSVDVTYQLDEMNEGVAKLMNWTEKTAKVVIGKNKITLCASILIKEAGWSVKFPEVNSLGTVLGFDPKVYEYRKEPWISQKIVNILTVNSILVHCDMISGSMVDGVKSPVIYNYSPNVVPGSKIVGDPVKPIYLPVLKDVKNELETDSWISKVKR